MELYHQTNRNNNVSGQINKKKYFPILNVIVDSTYPESYWLLKGVKLTTFPPQIEAND